MRHNNIVSAIEWLPEHLFTEEIVEADVESKEIEVLSHIPGRFLTPGRIEPVSYTHLDVYKRQRLYR